MWISLLLVGSCSVMFDPSLSHGESPNASRVGGAVPQLASTSLHLMQLDLRLCRRFLVVKYKPSPELNIFHERQLVFLTCHPNRGSQMSTLTFPSCVSFRPEVSRTSMDVNERYVRPCSEQLMPLSKL